MQVFEPTFEARQVPSDNVLADVIDHDPRLPREEASFISGMQHALNFAYYASDDEGLGDTDDVLDAVAFDEWRNREDDDA
jgi:hypothetical protein